MSSFEAATKMKRKLMVDATDNSSQEVQQSSNQSPEKGRKCSRLFGWLRRRKRKRLDFQESAVMAPCTRSLVHDHRLPEKCDLKKDAHSYYEKVIRVTECRSFNPCISLTCWRVTDFSCYF